MAQTPLIALPVAAIMATPSAPSFAISEDTMLHGSPGKTGPGPPASPKKNLPV
jgi:hypothetical protein